MWTILVRCQCHINKLSYLSVILEKIKRKTLKLKRKKKGLKSLKKKKEEIFFTRKKIRLKIARSQYFDRYKSEFKPQFNESMRVMKS